MTHLQSGNRDNDLGDRKSWVSRAHSARVELGTSATSEPALGWVTGGEFAVKTPGDRIDLVFAKRQATSRPRDRRHALVAESRALGGLLDDSRHARQSLEGVRLVELALSQGTRTPRGARCYHQQPMLVGVRRPAFTASSVSEPAHFVAAIQRSIFASSTSSGTAPSLQHFVVERRDVELRTQRLLRPLAQLDDLELTDLVRQRLSRESPRNARPRTPRASARWANSRTCSRASAGASSPCSECRVSVTRRIARHSSASSAPKRATGSL